jgi:nucleoside-diphosphate-sugar epimerase
MPEPVVALLGSTGFVGRAVATELARRGIEVRTVAAPRLPWPLGMRRGLPELPSGVRQDIVDGLAGEMAGATVVVNAAGRPDGTAPTSPHLYGANALLPTLVDRATRQAAAGRFVHISSAAVQGRAPLDETPRVAPFSPYTGSKALGEKLLLAEPAAGRVVFRPTWVHEAGRPQTRALVRLAASPAACVAGDGTAPTPQVLVSDVAEAVAALVLASGPVPPIVLQPPSGMTTGRLLRLLGGREPRHVPDQLARAAVHGLYGYGRLGRYAGAHARRVEMLLFGRRQEPGWLAGRRAVAPLRPAAWRRLAESERDTAGV